MEITVSVFGLLLEVDFLENVVKGELLNHGVLGDRGCWQSSMVLGCSRADKIGQEGHGP